MVAYYSRTIVESVRFRHGDYFFAKEVNMIDSFSGEYRFLSNFYPCTIKYEGLTYPTIEHAYQAAKTTDIAQRKAFALEGREIGLPTLSAGGAKKLGRKIPIRADWEEVKLDIMEDILKLKFSQRYFRQLLRDTQDEELVEGNLWHDVYWGVCNGIGQNQLGQLLMKIRSKLF